MNVVYTAQSELVGKPRADKRQCFELVRSRPNGDYTAHDVRVIVDAYFVYGALWGVDPVIALAQMAHETDYLASWWAQRPRRNPAGIGVTGYNQAQRPPSASWAMRDGRWFEGCSFVAWETDAVPAHMGRLLAYARTDWQLPSIPLRAVERALAVRGLPIVYRGAAPTLMGLNGRWAVPGTGYGQKIAAIARQMQQL